MSEKYGATINNSSIQSFKASEVDGEPLHPAVRMQHNIMSLHYQMDRIQLCLEEARQLKEVRRSQK